MSNGMDRRGFPFPAPLLVVVLGVAALLVFIGPRVLHPGNIAWLSEGDPAQHYLGWLFFRNGPWTFPLGLNPAFGLELSNGIAYSDSIPGLALVFKAISPVLPPVFQYYGWWLLACFILQAWFGWKLAGLVTPATLPRLLIAALFATAPPMVGRMTHHIALSGHFLILAAIYLVLRPERRFQHLYWLLLLVAAAFTSAYLLVMTGACWFADMARNLPARGAEWRSRIGMAIVTVSAVVVALWQSGFFAESDRGAGGFGVYRFNLLSLVDPKGWSHLLPELPGGRGDYEGFNYLGLGGLLLAVVALVVLLRGRGGGIGRHVRHRPVFVLVLVVLAVFAVSNNIGLGPLTVSVPLSDTLYGLVSTFRASGRMFWPVYYVILLAIVYLVFRGTALRTATALVAIALVVQVADTSARWAVERQRPMQAASSTWPTPLTSPFWAAAGERYDALRRLPPINTPPDWRWLGYFAATHDMGTNIVYLPRMGAKSLARSQRQADEAVRTGRYRPDSLYIVDPGQVTRVAATLDAEADLLAAVDGQYVVAPGWAACTDCPPLATPIGIGDDAPRPALGVPVRFGKDEPTLPYLAFGWSGLEPWGVWSEGESAELFFLAPADVRSIAIEANVFVPPGHTQRIAVLVNGVPAYREVFDRSPAAIDIPLDEALRQRVREDGYIALRFRLPDAISPTAAGTGRDDREIALGLKSLTLE